MLWALGVGLGLWCAVRGVQWSGWVGDEDQVGGKVPLGALRRKVNPNEAAWWSLARLQGIGPKRAKAIVAYREAFRKTHGPKARAFASAEDLAKVKGIGIKTALRAAREMIFE